MTLSIIIPIYNVEDTLRRCLNSVLSQGINDCEIILVDDGSTDNSGNIADEYSRKHENVVLLKKTNGGLSDARNYGIDHANGEYITFVDSDDEVRNKTYKQLLEILHAHPEYDILEYPVMQRPECKDRTLFTPGNNIFQDPLDWLAYKGSEHCWVCNKIYKRKMFESTRFLVGRKYEDIYLTASMIVQHPIIATTDKGLYVYHFNSNGIVANGKSNGLIELLDAQLHLTASLNIDTRQRRWHRLYLNMVTSQLYSYSQTRQIRLKTQYIKICGYGAWSETVKALLLNILGIRNLCRLFLFIRGRH